MQREECPLHYCRKDD
ncbi:hypothetical protein D043_2598A, partial [Vibrio parahaemolyticus EKP-021]